MSHVLPFGKHHPRVGRQVFLAATATVIGDVEIGDEASVWFGALVRGDVGSIVIGARTNVQDNAVIHLTSGGPNASLVEKQGAFTDVMLAALITGLTNVVTYTIDDLGTPITTLPGNTGRVDLHRLGHSMDMQLRDLVKASHMAQIAKMVTKLKSVPEAGGTMFDNTTIIYMPETGAGHHGPDTEAPMVIMSGVNSETSVASSRTTSFTSLKY